MGGWTVAPGTLGGSPKAESQKPGCPCGQSVCLQGGPSLWQPCGLGDGVSFHIPHISLWPWATLDLTYCGDGRLLLNAVPAALESVHVRASSSLT